MHHASASDVEITDDENARAISPMLDCLRFSGDCPYRKWIGYGHKLETYSRERGKGRIRALRITRMQPVIQLA